MSAGDDLRKIKDDVNKEYKEALEANWDRVYQELVKVARRGGAAYDVSFSYLDALTNFSYNDNFEETLLDFIESKGLDCTFCYRNNYVSIIWDK